LAGRISLFPAGRSPIQALDLTMKALGWRNKGWRQRALLVLTVVGLVLLASHPELRLLLPIVDALGFDLFLLMVGAQCMAYLRPALAIAYTHAFLPSARWLRSNLGFVGGYAGIYVDARLSRLLVSGKPPLQRFNPGSA
jgi:hypothetical protein